MKIIKRDGREVLFNGSKIAKAVAKANAEVSKIHQLNEFQIQAIADTVTKQCEKLPHIPSVEEVQDLVETAIMEMRGYEVAQKYVRYRYRRELARKANTTDDAILALIEQENEEIKQGQGFWRTAWRPSPSGRWLRRCSACACWPACGATPRARAT